MQRFKKVKMSSLQPTSGLNGSFSLTDLLSTVKFTETELATGVRMRYAEYGDPAGEPILFLHGFTDSWFSFSPVLAHLDAAKYHVCMPDQRGHGG